MARSIFDRGSAGYEAPMRAGYGIAKSTGALWQVDGNAQREEITEQMLRGYKGGSALARRISRMNRAYSRAKAAYLGHHAYSACVDLITGCALTNGEDPGRRAWRCVPARDPRTEEPMKNPDESQLEPWYGFVDNCNRRKKFDQLLPPMMTDFVAVNFLQAEVAPQPAIVNHLGLPQPGGFYQLPQAEIYPMVDDHGELLEATPFWQIREGLEPHPFSWSEMFYVEHGTMKGSGFYPTTPVDAIQVSVDSVIAAERFVRGFFRSGAKFGTVFEKEGEWSEDEALEFIKWVELEFMNVDTSHRPFALWGGLSIRDALPQNAHDFSKMIELWTADLNKVCGRFNVDPTLVSAVPKGGHLGGKSDRQQKWTELMVGPVNTRKEEFSQAVTFQFFRQGFGITDWDFELVKFRHAQDAETMLAVASAYAKAKECGLADWSRLPDLTVARRRFEPDFTEVTEEEHADFAKPPPAPAQQLPPGQESLTIVQPPKGKDSNQEPKQSDRAKRKHTKHVAEALGEMETWTVETSAKVVESMQGSIAKGIAALSSIYEEAHKNGYTDALKTAFKKANVLPVSGVIGADFKKAMKGHYADARAQAAKQIAAASKGARSSTTISGSGGVENFMESYAENLFEGEVYGKIEGAVRKTFLQGLSSGWDLDEFTAQVLAKANGIAETEIERTIRTASTEIFNTGRQRIAEESGDVAALEYHAVMDGDRTCPMCEAGDGLQIGIHDPDADRGRPPNHPHCRCVYSFIPTGEPWKTDAAQLAKFLSMIPPEYGGKLKEG